jgi:hypothetical protein
VKNKLFFSTLHLKPEELKSALRWSENETPKRLESLEDAPDFPCKYEKCLKKSTPQKSLLVFDDITKKKSSLTNLFWGDEGRGNQRSSLESHCHLQSRTPQPL